MKLKARLLLFSKGIAMGAADIVPGVSGGTIALITGIYESLINAVRSLNPYALQVWWQQGSLAFWRTIHGEFLLTLVLGIAVSFFSLANVIHYALEYYPQVLRALLFGLMLASIWVTARGLQQWQWTNLLFISVAALVAFQLTRFINVPLDPTPLTLFMAGLVAICAMILPGISGSFILWSIGLYEPIINAIRLLEWQRLLVFMAGCGIGLFSMVHLLSWLLRKYRAQTLSVLIGLMVGAVHQLWPWQYKVVSAMNQTGEAIAWAQIKVLPERYQQMTQTDPQLVLCLVMVSVSILAVYGLEMLAARRRL